MTEEPAIGVDLVDVDRFARAIRRWPRLLERVFTTEERDACALSTNIDERLAARFALKEATFKALGNGWPAIPYHDVEIVSLDDGPPAVRLSGRAETLARRRVASVSLSHDGGLAMAGIVMYPTEEG